MIQTAKGLSVLLIVLCGFQALADQQIPSLSPVTGEECHIEDTVPLLKKESYGSSGYQLKTLSKRPLTLEEKISIDKDVDLRIEHHGCEDIEADFGFTFIGDQYSSEELRLKKAAQIIKDLHFSDKPLINLRWLKDFSTKLQEKLGDKGNKPGSLNGTVICILESGSECITDGAVKISKNQVDFTYVERP